MIVSILLIFSGLNIFGIPNHNMNIHGTLIAITDNKKGTKQPKPTAFLSANALVVIQLDRVDSVDNRPSD